MNAENAALVASVDAACAEAALLALALARVDGDALDARLAGVADALDRARAEVAAARRVSAARSLSPTPS